MKFSFDVGNKERHIIDFSFNQFWGNLSIHVDGRRIVSDFRTVSFHLTKAYEFNVGTNEVHVVRIEKIRKLVFAGFRKTNYKVYLDEDLVEQLEGW